jgi:hypothetical protein
MNASTAMPHPDDESDEEEFERFRAQTEKLLADLEAKRVLLEQRGEDVDAMITEAQTLWNTYERAHRHADDAMENYLQSIADQVDASEELIKRVRDGITHWESKMERAASEGGMDRVRVWEAYQAWKEQIRLSVLKHSPNADHPDHKRVMAEVLRLLEE